MSKRMLNLPTAAILAAGAAALSAAAPNAATAMPLSGAPAIGKAARTAVAPVWYRDWDAGPAYAGGTAGSDLSGSPYYYGPYSYDYGYYDDPPPRAYGYYPRPPYRYGYDRDYRRRDDAVRYCASRYRSYDPATGTFVGHDGRSHPCP
jgi:BA14K-like protein